MSEYKLDRWDLSELAKDPKSPAFQKQISEVEVLAKKFERIKTKVKRLVVVFYRLNANRINESETR